MMRRRWRQAAVVAALAGATGCSMMRWGYRYADWYVEWRADGYLDLTRAQKLEVETRVDAFFAWHRAEEIPAYVALLHDVKARVTRGLDEDRVAWIADRVQARYRAIVERVATPSADVLSRLAPAQIDPFANRMDEENRELEEEFLASSPAEREKKRAKRMVERFEEWMGRLTGAQEAAIRSAVAEMPPTSDDWLSDRRRGQQLILTMLRTKAPAAEVAAHIRAWFLDAASRRTPEAQERSERLVTQTRALVVSIARTASDRQRDHALARLQSYIDDLEAISGRRGTD